MLSTPKPWGRLAHEVVVGPDSIAFLKAAHSIDEMNKDKEL